MFRGVGTVRASIIDNDRRDWSMKAKVDTETCVGCGLCVDIAPNVFSMEGDIAKVIVDQVAEEALAECKEAVEGCPVEAITIEEAS